LILHEINEVGRRIDRIGFSQRANLARLPYGPAVQLPAPLEATSTSIPRRLARP
jgi:hypothetical protein